MRIVLTGGITGGHIYPALAIGDKFREMEPDTEILFVGSTGGMENEIVPRHGYELKSVTTRELDRSNVLKVFDTVLGTEKGRIEASRIMKRFKPDIIVSTGSYVSVPVVMAGHRYGAKVFIHEQNAFPGLANRSMLRYADKLFLGFRTAARYFRDPSKLVYSGNPVRKDFYEIDRVAARSALGLTEDDFRIFIFGGSLGATALNDVGIEVVRRYGGKPGISILFGTGKRFYEDVVSRLTTEGLNGFGNVQILPYVQDMPNAFAGSDIIIARSGALSVAEITVSGRAALFIPSPNVTADHQYYNAKEVADNGGAAIVHEDAETPAKVIAILQEMLADRSVIQEMEIASRRSAPVAATGIIYTTIKEICGGK